VLEVVEGFDFVSELAGGEGLGVGLEKGEAGEEGLGGFKV
jgi:hypothetical protein